MARHNHRSYRNLHPIVEFLRMERHRQRLSQRELAAKIGYDKSSIGHAEVGYHNPTISFITDWAFGLGFEIQICASSKPTKSIAIPSLLSNKT